MEWGLLKLHEYFLVWGLIWENKELDWGWSCRWTGTLLWNTHLSPPALAQRGSQKKCSCLFSIKAVSMEEVNLEWREKSQRELRAWKDKWPAFTRVRLVLRMWQRVMRKTKGGSGESEMLWDNRGHHVLRCPMSCLPMNLLRFRRPE